LVKYINITKNKKQTQNHNVIKMAFENVFMNVEKSPDLAPTEANTERL